MDYPIITRDKERRMTEINGVMREVVETVTMDYGPQGVTRTYILASPGTAEQASENRRRLDKTLNGLGYCLKSS